MYKIGGGSSNDGIVRRTVENVLGLLEKYSSDEILVVVGWTSNERKISFTENLLQKKDDGQPYNHHKIWNFIKVVEDLKHFFDTYRKSF